VLIVPGPLTPATADPGEHLESENSVKVTDPVGGTVVVAANVAVSDKPAIATPAVPDDGDADVEIDGDAFATDTSSFGAPHLAVNPLLFASPA
jgi:hypothetical protein